MKLKVLNDKDRRTFKFGSKFSFAAPDDDWTVPTDVQKQADGTWIMTPGSPLQPAEYGVFTSMAPEALDPSMSTRLYGFSVGQGKAD